MTDQDPRRPVWLEWLTTVVSPVTLVVALMVYFAHVRRIAQSSTLGFDASILQEPSIPAYLMRSVGALYIPLTVLTAVALVLHWADRRVRQWLEDRRRLRSVLRISVAVPAVVIGLVPIAAVFALGGPLLRAYVVLIMPFLLAAAVSASWYGVLLRGAVQVRLPTRRTIGMAQPPLAGSLLVGFLIALLLFAGVDGFAKVVGRGLARQLIEHPEQHTRAVLLYSKEDLKLDPADAVGTPLAGEHEGYRHRYDGLRLAFVDGGSYFLIPRNQSKLIVLNKDGLRIEFSR